LAKTTKIIQASASNTVSISWALWGRSYRLR